MSIHPSLRQAGGKTGALRNVLKRYERVQALIRQGRWTEGRSVFGLPKTKQEKVKARKAAPKEAATTTQPASATTPPAPPTS